MFTCLKHDLKSKGCENPGTFSQNWIMCQKGIHAKEIEAVIAEYILIEIVKRFSKRTAVKHKMW